MLLGSSANSCSNAAAAAAAVAVTPGDAVQLHYRVSTKEHGKPLGSTAAGCAETCLCMQQMKQTVVDQRSNSGTCTQPHRVYIKSPVLAETTALHSCSSKLC